MGLDVSHDAFHGAYGAFNRFRQAICKAIGGSFPPHEDKSLDDRKWYWGDEDVVPDCDGDIAPKVCQHLADALESLLPALEKAGVGGGHIERDGGYAAVARRFIAGCRAAAADGERLEFH